MGHAAELQPVVLTPWPSCQDCLSWSEDDIAVACGEVVHILTPKSALTVRSRSGHPRWDFNTIKINLFSESEWPYQTLATIRHFSLGEEQSNSLVVALAFSHSGLGMHQRSVLAILTSNLVLSLWETDGSSGGYRRTCIVNHHLTSQTQEIGHGPERRTLRIRSFSWSPPLCNANLARNGVHHLIVADDSSTILILRVTKSLQGGFGSWTIDHKMRVSWTDIPGPMPTDRILSPLQARLEEQASISEVSQSRWREGSMQSNSDGVNRTASTATIAVRKGSVIRYFDVTAGRISEPHGASLAEDESGSDGYELALLDRDDLTTPEPPRYHENSTQISGHANLTIDSFKEALHPICEGFNQQHQLDGHYRVRLWGTAVAHNQAIAAACVTLHPSDMIEHTMPSSEKTTIIFQRLSHTSLRTTAPQRDKLEVQQQVFNFLSSKLDRASMIRSALDQKIIAIYETLVSANANVSGLAEKGNAVAQTSFGHDRNEIAMVSPNQRSVVTSNSVAANSSPHSAAPENCDICSAEIPFGRDTTSATCRAGHQFTRCNLSLVSIQEPGISKYCAGCGKQFLDLAKLGASEGPSLSQALFAEFNVCPYCQAKFRG